MHTYAHPPSLPIPYSQTFVDLFCKQRKSKGPAPGSFWKFAGFILFSVAHSLVLQNANSARHLIPASDRQPSSSPVLRIWLGTPHAKHLPEAWWPEVTAGPWQDIRLLHLPLVGKGWISPLPNPHS